MGRQCVIHVGFPSVYRNLVHGLAMGIDGYPMGLHQGWPISRPRIARESSMSFHQCWPMGRLLGRPRVSHGSPMHGSLS